MQREEFMRGLQVLISNVSDQSTRNLLAKELETALKSLRQENPNIKANRHVFVKRKCEQKGPQKVSTFSTRFHVVSNAFPKYQMLTF